MGPLNLVRFCGSVWTLASLKQLAFRKKICVVSNIILENYLKWQFLQKRLAGFARTPQNQIKELFFFFFFEKAYEGTPACSGNGKRFGVVDDHLEHRSYYCLSIFVWGLRPRSSDFLDDKLFSVLFYAFGWLKTKINENAWILMCPPCQYSRTSLTWTAKGQTKSVQNSMVSTLVKLGVATGHKYGKTGREKSVHSGGVSTGRGSTVFLP